MSDKVKFHFQNPEESSGYLLWQVTMLWQRRMNRALDEIELTHTQFVLLATIGWLSQKKSEVTQVEIANHSKTDRMMVSKVIKTLQQKQLVSRQEHTTDTRAKCVSLTKKGVSQLQKALQIVERIDGQFFSGLATQTNTFNASMVILLGKNAE